MIGASKERLAQTEQALLSLDRAAIGKLFAPSDGSTPSIEQIETMLIYAMEQIGQGWEQGRVSLSQVYMSGRMCEELVDSLLPASAPGRISVPTMAIAVLEDHHMLGLRLVYSILRASGYELRNYGRKGLDELVALVLADGVKVLLVSVLMLRSALRIKQLSDRLRATGCPVKLIVGGAPFRFDPSLWREVGADATADSAAGAVSIVRQMSEEVSTC
jgi:methanogenic corrinoid protein MtbC1